MKISLSLCTLLSLWKPNLNTEALSTSLPIFSRVHNVQSRITKLHMSEDFPSDSSVEALIDAEATPYYGTESESLVNSILNELPDSLVSGAGLSKDARAKINEALLGLEAMNPTKNPTSSPLLNGVWSLRYAAGYSPEWALPSPTR